MADLGIFVSTQKHLDWVIELTKAAKAKGKKVVVFFSGLSVHLTQKPEFAQLVGEAERITVCDVSFRAYGLHGKEVPGVGFKDFVTQARNAEMVEECARYLSM